MSIVTPSYNQGDFIEDTLLSVIRQDYPNIEHIIVDGGSTDQTLKILEDYDGKYNLRWVSEPDSGQSDALVKGFKMAHGDIIGWLNSDDMYFDSTTISFAVGQFHENPTTDVLYGDDVAVDENNRIIRVRRIYDWEYGKLLRWLSISQPATFFRRNVLSRNELDRTLHYAMDLEFWLRLGKKYRFQHVRRVLAAFRIHRRSKGSTSKDAARKEARKVLLAYGQEFGTKYYLLRAFWDLPGLLLRRALGLYDCLNLLNKLDELAFAPGGMTTLSLIISQLWPLPTARFPQPPVFESSTRG